MRLVIASAPGCRLPRGTRVPLGALAGRVQPARAVVQVVVGRDGLLRRLNRAWRGHDRPTDVLAFRYPREPGREPADPGAEVYVSLQRAAVQARARGHGLAQEVVLLVLHGLLHLQGHDHHRRAAARRMRAAEARELRWLARRWPRLGTAPLVPAGGTRRKGAG